MPIGIMIWQFFFHCTMLPAYAMMMNHGIKEHAAENTEEQKNAVPECVPETEMSEAAVEEAVEAAVEEAAEAAVEEAAETDEKSVSDKTEGQAVIDEPKEEKTEVMQTAVEDKADTVKAGAEKKSAGASRTAERKKKTAEDKKDAPIEELPDVRMDFVYETAGGRQITLGDIMEKVPEGADTAYIKLEDNQIYWVKGTKKGSVDIWEGDE